MKKVRIHFIGVKGVGIAPLAIIAKEAGFIVTGCDVGEEFITDPALKNAGIDPLLGFNPEHIENVDLVITTGAHGGLENLEVRYAKEKGIEVLTQGEAVARFQTGEIFSRESYGISVSGSHGKTTTTAMFSTVLSENKLDPSFSIGTGNIASLGAPGHFGEGKYFIVEADEYVNDPIHDKTPKFLLQSPKMIIVTNIDFDHPDIFNDIEDVEKVFLKFSQKIEEDGVLIACGDGRYNQSFLKQVKGKKISYGFSEKNDYVIEKISVSDGKTFFWLRKDGVILGEFSLQVLGEHNALNATAVLVGCLELGLSIDQIKKGLTSYMGSKRRSEFLGKVSTGALLYDDYAHHPEEIKKTIESFRKNFSKEKIICIFQPHMYSRTKKLLNDFSRSFDSCDEVVITEIFPSFREKIDPSFSGRILSDAINKRSKKSTFLSSLTDVVKYLDQKKEGKGTIIMTMGAGDVYKVGQELLKE